MHNRWPCAPARDMNNIHTYTHSFFTRLGGRSFPNRIYRCKFVCFDEQSDLRLYLTSDKNKIAFLSNLKDIGMSFCY